METIEQFWAIYLIRRIHMIVCCATEPVFGQLLKGVTEKYDLKEPSSSAATESDSNHADRILGS